MEWSAQRAELQLASQGGTGLLTHPGYRGEDTTVYFASSTDLDLADISENLLSIAKNHLNFLKKSVVGFEGAALAVEEDITGCDKKMRALDELDVRLAALRNQRRQAVAGGEATSSFDEAIAKASVETEGMELQKAHLEDEEAGLRLRLTAIEKALAAARAALDSCTFSIKIIQYCLLATKYNEQAEIAAELFRQLYEQDESVLTMAGQLETAVFQIGLPGLHPIASCHIPRLRLLWPRTNSMSKVRHEEIYFSPPGAKLTQTFFDLKRKFNFAL